MIIAAIQGTSEARKNALKNLFETGVWQQIVVRYVAQHGGSDQEGMDVFQDAMILFDRQIRANTFEQRGSLQTYFVGIAKWRWLYLQGQRKHALALDTHEYIADTTPSPEYQIISKEKQVLLDAAIAQLGERCQKILGLYKLSYTMKEAAEILGLSSPDMAKKQASECRKKLRTYLEERPELLKILRG